MTLVWNGPRNLTFTTFVPVHFTSSVRYRIRHGPEPARSLLPRIYPSPLGVYSFNFRHIYDRYFILSYSFRRNRLRRPLQSSISVTTPTGTSCAPGTLVCPLHSWLVTLSVSSPSLYPSKTVQVLHLLQDKPILDPKDFPLSLIFQTFLTGSVQIPSGIGGPFPETQLNQSILGDLRSKSSVYSFTLLFNTKSFDLVWKIWSFW